MPAPTRRDFLKFTTTSLLSAAGLLGLGGLIRFLDFQTEAPPKRIIDLGSSSKYPAGSRTLLPDVPAVLLSTEQGFTALSLVCTHLGCTVEPSANGFQCPCHGSRYGPQGEVQRGPSRRPLQALQVETTKDGRLLLHTA